MQVWWLMTDDWCMVEDSWLILDAWSIMIHERCLMNDERCVIIDDSRLMFDEWRLLIRWITLVQHPRHKFACTHPNIGRRPVQASKTPTAKNKKVNNLARWRVRSFAARWIIKSEEYATLLCTTNNISPLDKRRTILAPRGARYVD